MDPKEKALQGIFDDMDDLESNRMFPKDETKGVMITIEVSPKGGEEKEEGMNKGGEVCYSDGGVVEPPDMGMPPYLRKKKSQ